MEKISMEKVVDLADMRVQDMINKAKKRREKLGLTELQVARKLGIPVKNLRELESKRKMNWTLYDFVQLQILLQLADGDEPLVKAA